MIHSEKRQEKMYDGYQAEIFSESARSLPVMQPVEKTTFRFNLSMLRFNLSIEFIYPSKISFFHQEQGETFPTIPVFLSILAILLLMGCLIYEVIQPSVMLNWLSIAYIVLSALVLVSISWLVYLLNDRR